MGKIKNLANGAGLSVQKLTQALKLDDEFTELQSQVQILKAKNQKLEAEVNPLRRAIEQLKEKLAQLTSPLTLTFNRVTGTWVDEKTFIHYCPKCKASNLISPMKNDPYGWSCPACSAYYSDPDRPRPRTPVRRGGATSA